MAIVKRRQEADRLADLNEANKEISRAEQKALWEGKMVRSAAVRVSWCRAHD